MNKNLEKALEINESGKGLPFLEIGDVITLGELWNGEGEEPTLSGSFSYWLKDDDYINYGFIVIENSDDILETVIEIIYIELI